LSQLHFKLKRAKKKAPVEDILIKIIAISGAFLK